MPHTNSNTNTNTNASPNNDIDDNNNSAKQQFEFLFSKLSQCKCIVWKNIFDIENFKLYQGERETLNRWQCSRKYYFIIEHVLCTNNSPKKRTHICCSHIKMWKIPKKQTHSGKKSGITNGWKEQNVNHWDICYTDSVPRIIFLPRRVDFRRFVYCIVQVCIQQPATQSSSEKKNKPSILIENVNRAKIHWVNL